MHITNDAKNLCKGVFKIKIRLKTTVLNYLINTNYCNLKIILI